MFHVDPVCKKKIRKKEEYAILKYGGNTYHVCCNSCKEAFQKRPIDYIPEGNKERSKDNIGDHNK